MNNIIYVAISKKTGEIMSGVKGQYAFGDTASLNRSLANAYGWVARKKGLKARDLYYIEEVTVVGTPQEEVESNEA